MGIKIHFVNPTVDKENGRIVEDLITLLALKRLTMERS